MSNLFKSIFKSGNKKDAREHIDKSRYLILNNTDEFKIIIGQTQLPRNTRYICDYSMHTAKALSDVVKQIENKDFAYYRELTLKRTNIRLIFKKRVKQWFMFAIFVKENAISEELRLSFLYNLSQLAQDSEVSYDLRDNNTGFYLNPLSSLFNPRRPTDNESGDENENETERVVPTYRKKTHFDEYGCMTYTISNDKNGKMFNQNTGFIHDLIDPNKTLSDHKLWIPTLFDCSYNYNINDEKRDINKLIKSPILNVDYVKYRDLYINIGDIFKVIVQPSFEKLLGIKLGKNEKVIIKCMKYIFQKPGDAYNGNLHREGLGENIIAACIYYPSFAGSKYMKNGKLTLTLITKVKKKKWDKDEIISQSHEFDIKEGGFITFYNEGLHQLKNITYKDTKSAADVGPISKTILAFFLISPLDKNVIKDGNDNELKVNFIFYWKYYISYYLRVINKYGQKWLDDLIYSYLFGLNGYNRFGYKKRMRMRKEKSKKLTYNMIKGYHVCWSGGEADDYQYDVNEWVPRRPTDKIMNESDSDDYEYDIDGGYKESDSYSDDNQFLRT